LRPRSRRAPLVRSTDRLAGLSAGFVTALVCALGACAPEDTVIDTQFDPCAALCLEIGGADDEQRASIDDALAMWQRRGVADLADPGGSAPCLAIRFDRAGALFHGAYDDVAGVVYVNRDIGDRRARAVVIAHELGHAFGLFHVPPERRASVMNGGNLTVEPTDDDGLAIAAVWGACGR